MNWSILSLLAIVVLVQAKINEHSEFSWVDDELEESTFKTQLKLKQPHTRVDPSQCANGLYPPKPKMKVPTAVINLDLPPQQRWTKLVISKKKELYELLQVMKNETSIIFHGEIFKLVDDYFPKLAKTLPYPFYDEMLGISNATGIPIGEVTLYNVFYELFTVCTSIVAEAPDGTIYHGRNLDFGLFLGWDSKNHTWLTTEYLRKMIVQLDFQKNGKTVFQAINFVGYVGVITGMKPKAFSLTVDDRFKLDGGYIGILEWVLGIRTGSWMGFLSRQVLENNATYEAAQKTLATRPLLAPVYFILGGRTSGQGSVITRSRNNFDIWSIGQRSYSQNSTWYVLETNYDHWVAPPTIDDRRLPGIHCMDEAGRSNVSFAMLYNVLSTQPVDNLLTVYTSLIQVEKGLIEAWIQTCDFCFPW